MAVLLQSSGMPVCRLSQLIGLPDMPQVLYQLTHIDCTGMLSPIYGVSACMCAVAV